jgi:hypothetical protein
LKANVPALERLLEHNRKGKIVWQHVGRDTIGDTLTPELLERLLSRHSNLYCALWIRSKDMPASSGPGGKNQILDSNCRLKDEWLNLFEKYPDRFMIGTDLFVASSGENDKSFESTWKFLKMLPPDLADKIGGENAGKIYKIGI